MISYCIVAYRPPYVRWLIQDLIRKTTCPYEILIWLNTADRDLMELIRSRQTEGDPVHVVGTTPENIGMVGFKHLFLRARYPIITQLDDDVLRVSHRIGEIATDIFARHPSVGQIVADVWQDDWTNGARPKLSDYTPWDSADGLLEGPIDGWFSMYHRSTLPVLMQAPFSKYLFLGSWVRAMLAGSGRRGLLCTKVKVFHAIGPRYASLFGMLDFEIEKYQSVGREWLSEIYAGWKASPPPPALVEEGRRIAYEGVDAFGLPSEGA